MEAKVLYSKKRIQKKIYQLASQIAEAGIDNPVFMVVLDGAMFFASDLMKALDYWDVHPEMTTVRVKSYTSNRKQGKIKLIKDWEIDLNGRNIVIVEDIIDSGNTIRFLMQQIYRKNDPASIKICSLLKRRTAEVYADFLGFSVSEDAWLVGYGLDNDGKQRSLTDIYTLSN